MAFIDRLVKVVFESANPITPRLLERVFDVLVQFRFKAST